jgi:hypothetical protein
MWCTKLVWVHMRERTVSVELSEHEIEVLVRRPVPRQQRSVREASERRKRCVSVMDHAVR